MVTKSDTPVGVVEIAELLGVRRATVDQWRQRDLLPVPEWTVGGRPAWRMSTILQWAKRTGRPTSLELSARRILEELETPKIAFTGKMLAAIVEASQLISKSPYLALSLVGQELDRERGRFQRSGRKRELRHLEQSHQRVIEAMSGFHAMSE